MSLGLDTFIYYATAPIRALRALALCPLGRRCLLRHCHILQCETLWALNRFVSPTDSGLPEAIAILQPSKPLQAVTRASHVIAPVAVALTAIGQSLDATPLRVNSPARTTTRSRSCSARPRSPDQASRAAPCLPPGSPARSPSRRRSMASIRITGQVGNSAGKAVGGIGGAIGNLLGSGEVGKQIEKFRRQDARPARDFRGNVAVTSRPSSRPHGGSSPTSPAGSISATPAPTSRASRSISATRSNRCSTRR